MSISFTMWTQNKSVYYTNIKKYLAKYYKNANLVENCLIFVILRNNAIVLVILNTQYGYQFQSPCERSIYVNNKLP